MFLKVCFPLVMGRVEVLRMPEVRFARRCWVSVGGVDEDEVVVKVGDLYVVGAVDDWYAVPAHAVRRLLAKLLNASEEEISLEC
jgi:predicted RecB family endonuclease